MSDFDGFISLFYDYLERRSLRITFYRRMVARLCVSMDGEFTAEQIHSLARSFENARPLTIATVYRTLNELVDAEVLTYESDFDGITYRVR
ncbi:MAG: transcriptional repressor [Planctomycetota bacterium]